MTARVQAVALGLFAAVLLRLCRGGTLADFVRPSTRWRVQLAAITLLVLVLTLVAKPVAERVVARRRSLAGADPSAPQSGGPERGARAGWLVLAPVCLVTLVAPAPLGALTAAHAPPTAPARPDAGFATLAARDPVDLPLTQLVLRSVWQADGPLAGRDLRVTGFVLRHDPDGFVLARLVITCCAADARPYEVVVHSRGSPPPNGTWVTVTGRYLGPGGPGRVLPRLGARKVAVVPQPANPYG